MLHMLNKISLKTLTIFLVIAVLIGIVLPLSASAFAPDMVLGASDITEAEAYAAYVQMFEEQGIATDIISVYSFQWDEPTKSCTVTDMDTGSIVDAVYIDADGVYHSFVLGYTTSFDGISENTISAVTVGVAGFFSMASEAFSFFTDNPLLMAMISITFAGVALGFTARAFETSRK